MAGAGLTMARLFRVLVCFTVCAALAGCGEENPKTYPIPGRLVYTDGKPVPGATIVLRTTHREKVVVARGAVDKDGRFELTTFATKDGVIEGDHEITIIPIPGSDGDGPPKRIIPTKYSSAETSDLTFTVKADTPEILITIEPVGKR